MITIELLEKYGAQQVKLEKKEQLFPEGASAKCYYQVVKGVMKMFNLSDDGKEFLQGIFEDGSSFGEPPLLGDFPYPAAAMAIEPTTLLKLPKQDFLTLLKDNPLVHLKFTRLLCNRLAYKAMMGKEISVYPPEHRILTLLHYLKKQQEDANYMVPLTRQQIAEFTGMRVETVIRTIKKLEVDGKLQLQNHKIIL